MASKRSLMIESMANQLKNVDNKPALKGNAYKVFKPDWTCINFKYEVGKTYETDKEIYLCNHGFHACKKLANCFNYYEFDPSNKVAEVLLEGHIIHGEDKSVCSKITILRELSWGEVLEMVNAGNSNTGYRNSGDSNSGDRNSGDSNSGDRNSGDWNSGNRNSGDRNSGYSNSGDRNSGNRNSGDSNSGDRNSGDSNSGDRNSGDRNSGDWNSGDRNSGDSNSGDRNSGYRNSGDRNSGNRNSGYRNSGYWNSGNRNSGYRNSGDRNSGNSNSGDWNSCNFSSGFLNTKEGCIRIFNKETNLKRNEIEFPECFYFNLIEWINESDMTEKEKSDHPEYKTTGGYLKQFTYKEAWGNALKDITEEEKQQILDLPNYDPDIFEEITGVRIEN